MIHSRYTLFFRTSRSVTREAVSHKKFCQSWLIGFVLSLVVPLIAGAAEPWTMHVIDDSSQGADGVRLQDVNGDSLLDVCTGWEEGGVIRVYLHPGPKKCREKWPAVTVGKVASPEDAVFCDLDADGRVDVVSCCEGKNRSVYFHWAPKDEAAYLDAASWRTEAVECVRGKQMWMYCAPMQVDGRRGVDLIIGSKMAGGSVGWLESPADPRDVAAWRFHRLSPAGWIMSLETVDMDADGDLDVLMSDRERKMRSVRWLENPGAEEASKDTPWRNHFVGGRGQRPMFLTVSDLDRDGVDDILSATRNGHILFLRRDSPRSNTWQEYTIANPLARPFGKAVRVADVNLDGRLDLVHTSSDVKEKRTPNVFWMELNASSPERIETTIHDIGGQRGIKYDLIQMIDLDADGDLDVLTCEERENLGVIWYENPTRGGQGGAGGQSN